VLGSENLCDGNRTVAMREDWQSGTGDQGLLARQNPAMP
jgi:hypothetical protein